MLYRCNSLMSHSLKTNMANTSSDICISHWRSHALRANKSRPCEILPEQYGNRVNHCSNLSIHSLLDINYLRCPVVAFDLSILPCILQLSSMVSSSPIVPTTSSTAPLLYDRHHLLLVDVQRKCCVAVASISKTIKITSHLKIAKENLVTTKINPHNTRTLFLIVIP